MTLVFLAQMFGGNMRKINYQPVIDAVLYDSTRVSDSLIHITFRQ